jgi:hypothetical protein
MAPNWKDLPGTNTLAFCEHYQRKRFYKIVPRGQCYKTLYGRNCVTIGVTQSKSQRNTPLVVQLRP